MRWIKVATVVTALVVSATTARADKSANAFVDPSSLLGGANGFTNANSANLLLKTYSVGALKQSGCKIKIQFARLSGFVDGEKMICLVNTDAKVVDIGTYPGSFWGQTLVIHPFYNGISLKAAAKADTADIGCGSTNALAVNASVNCYKWDAGYDAAALCTANWIPNPELDPAGVTTTTDGLLGICSYATHGQRLPAPGTGLVARDGASSPLKP